MLNLLNIISWLLAISIGISIFAIEDDLAFFAVIISIIIKFILSKKNIRSCLINYKNEIRKNILEEINLSKDTYIKTENKKEEIKENISDFENNNINSYDLDNKVVSKELLNDDEIKKFLVHIDKEKEEEINTIEKIEPEEETPSKVMIFLKEFFAENLMAKVGGILLALGMIFLMSLVYSYVGPVAKIIIGFAVGFGVYFIGTILEKKGLKTESMILIGTGILINYIVILSGRFIVGDNDGILNSSLTFVLLILNTVFSVVSSYLYKSKNMLLFSIFFAYIIPFLVGSSGSKYSYLVLIGYSIILSIGALFISNKEHQNGNQTNSLVLFYFTLVLGNLLVLVASSNDASSFITKMIGFNIINFLSIYFIYKNSFTNHIINMFIIGFVYLSLILGVGADNLGDGFNQFGIFISYFLPIVGFIGCIIFFSLNFVLSSLVYLLLAPLIIILSLLFSGNLFLGILVIPIILIIYLIGFSLLAISNTLKYVYFSVLGIFLFFANLHFSFNVNIQELGVFLTLVLTGFIFLMSSYYLSNKKDLSYLYTLGTVFFIMILSSIIQVKGFFAIYSAISIILFFICNYLAPFINKNLVLNDTKNLVLGNIFGILFVGINMFIFGQVYFPGVTLGIGFAILAILYFIGGYILFSKIDFKKEEKKEENKNFIYTFLAIAISLFSIAVAIIFAKMPIVISLIWILEGTIILFFANRINSQKAYIASIILTIIGLGKFLILFDSTFAKGDLVGILFVFISLFLNIIFIKDTLLSAKNITKVLHIFGTLMIIFSILTIFDTHSNSGVLFPTVGIYFGILLFSYNYLKDHFLKISTIIILSLIFLIQIFATDVIRDYFYNYIFTFICLVLVALEYLFFKDKNSKYLLNSFALYFFIITSIYLYHITSDVFSLTIYWGVLSFLGINIGISKDLKPLRTIGIILVIVTLAKITFYDVWASFDNPIIRIVALMFVGGIMMYISSIYSKNNLSFKKDLSFDFGESEEKIDENVINEKVVEKENIKTETKQDFYINTQIKDMDVSDIDSIKFKMKNSKTFTIRSKNLFKIVRLVILNLNKTTFESKELETIYSTVIKNYKSDLNEVDYKKLTGIIKEFVEVGGEVEIINKK